MGDEESTPEPKKTSGRGALAWLAIVGLGLGVAYLVSERNARRYYLTAEKGQLVVKRGLLFPTGTQAWRPEDPMMGAAYAPIDPPKGAPIPAEQSFDEQGALDRALYDLLAAWAKSDIATERSELLQRGLAYLDRAEKLSGLSAAQRDDLKTLRAESGYYEARQLIEQGADKLRQARDRLRLSGESPTRHAREALDLFHRIEPVVDDVYRAARSAGADAPLPVRHEPAPLALPQGPVLPVAGDGGPAADGGAADSGPGKSLP
jgi:hypothetical protein